MVSVALTRISCCSDKGREGKGRGTSKTSNGTAPSTVASGACLSGQDRLPAGTLLAGALILSRSPSISDNRAC